MRLASLLWYHLQAAGFVKSTNAIPACYVYGQRSTDRWMATTAGETYPSIELPNTPIRPLDEVAAFHALIEDLALLRDIRIDPNTHLSRRH